MIRFDTTVSISIFLTLLVAQLTMAADSEPQLDLSLFQPSLKRLDNLPRSQEDNARVDLGRHLFYEKRLSQDNSISCNSCHDLKNYGVDGEAFSMGLGKVRVGRNSPTVYNAFAHIAQFWDGRSPTVEEQAKGPILAGKEMGMPSPGAVVEKLKKIPEYRALFHAAFPRDEDPINYDNVGLAIGAFERNLTTPSRFDQYLEGKQEALTPEEVQGLRLFVQRGCTTCHDSTLIGGQRYQKAGLVKPWPNQSDTGRYEVTKQEADKFVFKVPSLRNVSKTAPYFHDGSANELEEAIEIMGRHQLGIELPEDEVKAIAAFLDSLTGELPIEFITPKPLLSEKEAHFE